MNPTTQTIAELKQTTQIESLWTFLAGLPFTTEAQILYAVLIFGMIGFTGSWLVKWSSGQAACGFVGYFFRTEWRRTVATVCAYVGVMASGIGTGVFFATVGGQDVFVGWYTVLWTSITTAFSCDMGINKGKRIEWTQEQRAIAVTTEALKP